MNASPAPAEILHIILTRFNVRSGGKEQTLRQHPDWLKQRFELFDQFCFPSVHAQTHKDFKWLVFFDEETPEPFKSKIETYRVCPQFLPVFVGEWKTGVVPQEINRHITPAHKYLLTTRLDNDDALHAGFMESLRRNVTAATPCFYNFQYGLIYSEGRIFKHIDLSNAFASYFESIDGYQTVWKIQHHLIRESGALAQLTLPDAWLQVIHGRNVSNRVKGRRARTSLLADGYAHLTKVTFNQGSWLDWLLESVLFYPARVSREYAIRLIKPLLKH